MTTSKSAFAIWIPEASRIAEAKVAHDFVRSSRKTFVDSEVLVQPEECLSQNDMLATLPEPEAAALIPHLKVIRYKLGDTLFHAGESADYVFFPLQGAVISLIAQMSDGKDYEVGLVGREGLAGLWVVLGSKSHMYRAVAQVPGAVLRIKLEKLHPEFARGGALQESILGYTTYLLTQIALTAVCNRAHRLNQRLARWLLMTRDRAGSNEFPATHEFLSSMLGASRTDVTLAAGALRKAKIIYYTRGKVKILDNQKLEAIACECYRLAKCT